MSGGSKVFEIEAERRRKIGEASRRRWADPKYKAKTSKAIQDAQLKDAKQISERSLAMWKKPQRREIMKEKIKASWQRDGFKDQLRDVHKKRWASNNELRQRYSMMMKSLLADPTIRKERVSNFMRVMSQKSPNDLEKKYIMLFDLYFPGQLLFTGDGKVIINGRCPDFVHTAEKKIIEIFGVYWHGRGDEPERVGFFGQQGYDTLVIWENENSDDAIRRVHQFLNP